MFTAYDLLYIFPEPMGVFVVPTSCSKFSNERDTIKTFSVESKITISSRKYFNLLSIDSSVVCST